MRMMMIVRFPHEIFNDAVSDGSADTKTRAILDDVKPEAVYFTEMNGRRTAVLVVDVENPSKVPALAEPWFLTFQADVEFHIVMTPTDLQNAGLSQLGRKWGYA